MTGLMMDSQEGHNAVVQFLLEGTADANRVTNKGVTALMIASQHGQDEVVKTLIWEGKADVNVATLSGDTALIWASNGGHDEIVKRLINSGAHVNKPANGGYTAATVALEKAFQKGNDATVNTIITLINKDENHVCNKCSKTTRDLKRILKKCSGCKKVYHCSKECLKADWKAHKPVCFM